MNARWVIARVTRSLLEVEDNSFSLFPGGHFAFPVLSITVNATKALTSARPSAVSMTRLKP